MFQAQPIVSSAATPHGPSKVQRPPATQAVDAASACKSRMASSCGSTLRLLAGVVTHSRALPTRSLPILQTWGSTMQTHLLVEYGQLPIRILTDHGCVRWAAADERDVEAARQDGAQASEAVAESWKCDHRQRGTLAPEGTRSRAILIHGCLGSEVAGCCRVMRWLGRVVLTPRAVATRRFDWLLIADDDVFVRPDVACVLRALDPLQPLFLPAKHAHDSGKAPCVSVGGSGGGMAAARVAARVVVRAAAARVEAAKVAAISDCNRISLCPDSRPVRQRPTQLSLPAGYGVLSFGFARLLSGGWAARLRMQCAAYGWYYDLALAFASWAFEVDLVPALDWTRTAVSAWSGGQRRLWGNGSVIYHKADTEYDFVGLLHSCAFGEGVHPPNRRALAPFLRERIPQRQYGAIVARARARGEVIQSVNSTSRLGLLWSCKWVTSQATSGATSPSRAAMTRFPRNRRTIQVQAQSKRLVVAARSSDRYRPRKP